MGGIEGREGKKETSKGKEKDTYIAVLGGMTKFYHGK